MEGRHSPSVHRHLHTHPQTPGGLLPRSTTFQPRSQVQASPVVVWQGLPPALSLVSLLYNVRNMDGVNFKAPGCTDMLWFVPLGDSIHAPSSPV